MITKRDWNEHFEKKKRRRLPIFSRVRRMKVQVFNSVRAIVLFAWTNFEQTSALAISDIFVMELNWKCVAVEKGDGLRTRYPHRIYIRGRYGWRRQNDSIYVLRCRQRCIIVTALSPSFIEENYENNVAWSVEKLLECITCSRNEYMLARETKRIFSFIFTKIFVKFSDWFRSWENGGASFAPERGWITPCTLNLVGICCATW